MAFEKELEKKAVEIAEKVGEETAKIESEAKEVEEKVLEETVEVIEKEQLDFPEIPTGMVVECLSFIGKEPVVFNRRTYRGDRCDLCLEFIAVNQKMEVVNSEISIEERNGKRH